MKINVITENETIKETNVSNNEFKSLLKSHIKKRPSGKGCFIYSSQSLYDYIIERRLKASRKKIRRR